VNEDRGKEVEGRMKKKKKNIKKKRLENVVIT